MHLEVQGNNGYHATKKWLEAEPLTDTTFDALPPGEYSVAAYALDNEEGPFPEHTLYASWSKVTVVPHASTATTLIMQEVATGDGSITSPFIHAISVTGVPPVIGEPLRLSAAVRGAPSQTYQWAVSCADDPSPTAPFSDPTDISTDLTLYRCSGDATVTFSVTNPGNDHGIGSLTASVQFTLHYVPQGVSVSIIALNSWPNITSIGTTSNAEPVPGGTISLVATAYDPDGDNLTYSWSDDCGGSFAGAATLAPTWTAPSMPGAICVLELTVHEYGNEDGHNVGHNSGTFTLQIAPSL